MNLADTLYSLSWRYCHDFAGVWARYVKYIAMHVWVLWFFFSFFGRKFGTRRRNFFMKLRTVKSRSFCSEYLSYSLRIELTSVSISSRSMRACRAIWCRANMRFVWLNWPQPSKILMKTSNRHISHILRHKSFILTEDWAFVTANW
jgi:hypothetical protein